MRTRPWNTTTSPAVEPFGTMTEPESTTWSSAAGAGVVDGDGDAETCVWACAAAGTASDRHGGHKQHEGLRPTSITPLLGIAASYRRACVRRPRRAPPHACGAPCRYRSVDPYAHDGSADDRDMEAYFRRVVEQLPVIVYIEDVAGEPGTPGTLLYASPQVEAILGFTAREWLERPPGVGGAVPPR